MHNLVDIDQALFEDGGDRPLVVDLDDTLLRTDTFVEMLAVACGRPALMMAVLGQARHGRAAMKACVAGAVSLDPALLPYNDDVLSLVQKAREGGRRTVLATAANERVAQSIADHTGLFDEVLSSTETKNLKGKTKAEALVEKFGRGGFDYVGDSAADHPVWDCAFGGVTVGKRRTLSCTALGHISGDSPATTARSVVKAARPYQWVKNVLAFLPIIASGAFFDLDGWFGAFLAFLSLSLVASSVYLINDLVDLPSDRAHPRKKRRPFASGKAPVWTGFVGFAAGLTAGLAIGWASGALPIILIYLVMTLSYSAGLKRRLVVDLFLLAALYTVRVVAGGVASGHLVSLWLLGFSGFLFLDLAALKRVGELIDLSGRGEQSAAGRGYRVDDIPLVQTIGIASAFASTVVLALYVNNGAALAAYETEAVLWLVGPLLLYWQIRLWIAANRGMMTDDPILFAARDIGSWIAAFLLGLCVLAAYVDWSGIFGFAAVY